MKKVFTTAIIASFAISVNAQIEMPKELTCTEEAFNFSVSLGTRLKLGTPKMSPAEITRTPPGYNPSWSSKNYSTTPEEDLPLFFDRSSAANSPGYTFNLQNDGSLFSPDRIRFIDKLRAIYSTDGYIMPVNYKPVKCN